MRKDGMLYVVFIFMFLVVVGGSSNTVVACDFSEGTDEHADANQIILSRAIHNDNSVEAMTCEGIPYNNKEDKIIIASSRINRQSSDSMYSEGISFEELEAVHIANIREKVLNVKPAAGSDL